MNALHRLEQFKKLAALRLEIIGCVPNKVGGFVRDGGTTVVFGPGRDYVMFETTCDSFADAAVQAIGTTDANGARLNHENSIRALVLAVEALTQASLALRKIHYNETAASIESMAAEALQVAMGADTVRIPIEGILGLKEADYMQAMNGGHDHGDDSSSID